MVDTVPFMQMLKDLRLIKIEPVDRDFLMRLKKLLESGGSLHTNDARRIRFMYSRYGRKIKSLHEAQERARVSMSKEQMGLTDDELKQARRERLRKLKEKFTDFGF